MIENHGLVEYLLSTSGDLTGREGLTAQQIKRFTDEMPGGFFIYRSGSGQILYANHAVLRIFGCETAEEFQELTGGSFHGMVHPEDLQAVEKSIREQIFDSRYDLDYVEYRIIRRDRSVCWVEDFGHYIETERLGGVFYVFLADITERRRRSMAERSAILEEKLQKERELQEQAEQNTQFLEQMNDELVRRLELIEGLSADYEVVFHADLEQNIIQPYRVSSRECFHFGRDLQVRPYQGFAEEYAHRWVHPADRENFLSGLSPDHIRETLKKVRTYHIDYRILRDGETEFVQAFLVNVSPSAEEATQIMFGCRTVDEEVRREKARTAMLEDALRQAKLAGEARNTFLSNMSHDMRTPMNAIMGFTALAQRHLHDPERLKSDLERISASSARLLRLVNDVLELSWLESGQVHIEETVCVLPELAKEVWEEVLPRAKEEGVELTLNGPEAVHPKVWCDRPKLRQALVRLALGAVKCTGSGGRVELSLRERSATRAYGAYYFIADCYGLKEDLSGSVFTPFDRQEITAAADAAGSDLGLPIVKHIIELMGGMVETGAMAEGGRLIASLNLRLQEETEVRASVFQAGGRRVLVVEDNELNREIAQELLEEAGFQVETAGDGAEAVEMVRASQPGYYALILMDLRMPVMDGHAAARAIRALENPGLAGVPIVALSANTFDEDRKQSAESGMNAHLAKPLDVDRLLEVISGITGAP